MQENQQELAGRQHRWTKIWESGFRVIQIALASADQARVDGS